MTEHHLALVEAATGGLLAEHELSADQRGYRAALRLARDEGERRLWALEGSGSYGAGLARFLAAHGERVLGVKRPRRSGRSRPAEDGYARPGMPGQGA